MTTIANFRDIGRKTTANDQQVKEKKLFRSGDLSHLSEGDQSFLMQECKLKTIVDFRSESERESAADTEIAGVKYIPLDVLKDSVDQNGSLESMMTATISAEEMMESIYKNLVLVESAHKGYEQFLNLLIESEGQPLIFHCSAGKDRTGYAAALILRLLGVSLEDIYGDYLLTNIQRKDVNKNILEQVKKSGQFSQEQLVQIEVMLDVKKEYLETAFQTIDETYGDFSTYVTEVLKFSDEKKEKLRSLYLR